MVGVSGNNRKHVKMERFICCIDFIRIGSMCQKRDGEREVVISAARAPAIESASPFISENYSISHLFSSVAVSTLDSSHTEPDPSRRVFESPCKLIFITYAFLRKKLIED